MTQIDLFGNEIIEPVFTYKLDKKFKKVSFYDYKAFLEKFEIKKTTDECITPESVYQCVLNHVRQTVDITGLKILRPFYQGGDYENDYYPEDSIVIDNPPFSIISKIARFYQKRKIKFYLFAPHLTLFSQRNITWTCIVVNADIIYENGAKVKTSFISNMFENIRVIGDVGLNTKLNKFNNTDKNKLPIYEYPNHVLTVSMVTNIVNKGISIVFENDSLYQIVGLDNMRKYNKAIYGSGFLISEKAAAEKAAAEKQNVIKWKLSDREKQIIEKLK